MKEGAEEVLELSLLSFGDFGSVADRVQCVSDLFLLFRRRQSQFDRAEGVSVECGNGHSLAVLGQVERQYLVIDELWDIPAEILHVEQDVVSPEILGNEKRLSSGRSASDDCDAGGLNIRGVVVTNHLSCSDYRNRSFPEILLPKVVATLEGHELVECHHVPAFGDGADFGLFLGFVAEACGEELVHEGLFQLGGGLNDPLLRFNRPLHRRKDVRDLLLLGEWGDVYLKIPEVGFVQDRNRRLNGALLELVPILVEAVVNKFGVMLLIANQRIDLLVSG